MTERSQGSGESDPRDSHNLVSPFFSPPPLLPAFPGVLMSLFTVVAALLIYKFRDLSSCSLVLRFISPSLSLFFALFPPHTLTLFNLRRDSAAREPDGAMTGPQ